MKYSFSVVVELRVGHEQQAGLRRSFELLKTLPTSFTKNREMDFHSRSDGSDMQAGGLRR